MTEIALATSSLGGGVTESKVRIQTREVAAAFARCLLRLDVGSLPYAAINLIHGPGSRLMGVLHPTQLVDSVTLRINLWGNKNWPSQYEDDTNGKLSE